MKSLEEKKKMNMNMTNSIDNNKLESISFVNNNQDISEISKSFKKKMHIKRNCNYYPNLHSYLNNNVIHKKLINKNMSLSTINYNQVDDFSSHLNKKSSNKNHSVNESISYYLNKIDESLNNNNINNNSRNNFGKIPKNAKFINVEKSKGQPVNITNNNYNVQKNNVLINLNNINLEKLKLQRKLAEYRKMIDRKINSLKKGNINKKKNSAYRNGKSSIKLKKDGKNDRLNSSRISNNDVEKSFFIKRTGLEKINTSFKINKRDTSYNFERTKKK